MKGEFWKQFSKLKQVHNLDHEFHWLTRLTCFNPKHYCLDIKKKRLNDSLSNILFILTQSRSWDFLTEIHLNKLIKNIFGILFNKVLLFIYFVFNNIKANIFKID
jgi:hypothetical protein